MDNRQIAQIFGEIADLLEIEAANPFRIRAYRNAARVIGEWGRDAREMVEKGEDLTRLPGIGHDLALKIEEIARTGHCAFLGRLHGELPPAITELLHIPGLGPKRVRALYQELHVQTPDDLLRAAREGRIRALPGFAEKTEQHILQAVEAHTTKKKRFRLAVAEQYADALAGYLRRHPSAERVEVAGSFRRRKETVGDIDLLAIAEDGPAVMQRFAGYDEVAEVLSAGDTRGSVLLRCGLQVDLRVVPQSSFGAALHYFTGSKPHNIAIRALGLKRGLKINEYGVFRGKRKIAGRTEEEVFASVGLPWIPPELREDRGEIQPGRHRPERATPVAAQPGRAERVADRRGRVPHELRALEDQRHLLDDPPGAQLDVVEGGELLLQPVHRVVVAGVGAGSELGLVPSSDGTHVRVPIPSLTEERRKELVKVAHRHAEEGRVAIRHARQEANKELKRKQSAHEVSEDDARRQMDEVQKMTDAELYEITAKGKGKMPGYASKLSKEQIQELIAHMRALGKKK